MIRSIARAYNYRARGSVSRAQFAGMISARMRIKALAFTLALVAPLLLPACARRTEQHGHARHIVLVVWDGMRPDFVTEQNAPTLWQLAQEGVTFRNHHSTYISATNVNGTVMATGVFPERSGLIANLEFRPEIDAASSFDTADAESIRKSDALPNHPYLTAQTLPELLQAHGKRTAIAGTKTVARLFDRFANGGEPFPVLAMGNARPDAIREALSDSLGAFPTKQTPNTAQDEWTTAALLGTFWKQDVAEFSLLWLSDPDFAQHDTAPGSPAALAGIKSSDAQLAKVLAALEAKGLRDQTDVLVVSDHGFSTVDRAVDVPELLDAAGFHAAKKLPPDSEPGTILAIGNGGTVLFYITDHDPAVTRKLIAWLQQTDFAGVIFAREQIEGAFQLSDVHLDKPNGPDVVMAFRWNAQPNEFGVAGSITADWNRAAGKGTHATLSRFDLHNTLIAAGPDFRRRFSDDLPSGNIDLAPTILHILGIKPEAKLDGRVLSEALIVGERPTGSTTKTMEASRDFGSAKWQQHLTFSRLNDVLYVDEGNGASTTNTP